jgi:hypothetical protein
VIYADNADPGQVHRQPAGRRLVQPGRRGVRRRGP